MRGKVSVGEPKTLRGRRPIALDPSTVAVLKAHRKERLGHSTIAITLGIYSHVAPTLHDEAAELVADLIL